jgi:hypothetical protein
MHKIVMLKDFIYAFEKDITNTDPKIFRLFIK